MYPENDEVTALPLGRAQGKPVLTISVMALAGLVFAWQQVDFRGVVNLLAPGAIELRSGVLQQMAAGNLWGGLLALGRASLGLLTSVFPHGDFLHIAFNLSWIWMFGRVLEENVSKGFWLLLFVTCAVFASAAELAWSDQLGIGLSGVVYGMFGFIWFTRFRYPAFHGVINQQTALWLTGWLVFCIVMTKTGTMNVANGAHFGGLVVGSVIGLCARKSLWGAAAVCLAFLGLSIGSVMYAPWSPSYNALAAVEAFRRGDYEAARERAAAVVKMDGGQSAWAAALLADINARQGRYLAAKEDFERGAETWKDDVAFLNQYAWLLATCPEDNVRDGRKAVELATRAAELTNWNDGSVLDTLAAAYAESGDFTAAVKWQEKAAGLLPEEKDVAEHLALYEKGQALRESR